MRLCWLKPVRELQDQCQYVIVSLSTVRLEVVDWWQGSQIPSSPAMQVVWPRSHLLQERDHHNYGGTESIGWGCVVYSNHCEVNTRFWYWMMGEAFLHLPAKWLEHDLGGCQTIPGYGIIWYYRTVCHWLPVSSSKLYSRPDSLCNHDVHRCTVQAHRPSEVCSQCDTVGVVFLGAPTTLLHGVPCIALGNAFGHGADVMKLVQVGRSSRCMKPTSNNPWLR